MDLKVVCSVTLLLIMTLSFSNEVSAQETISPETYSPIINYHEKEVFYPANVEDYLSVSYAYDVSGDIIDEEMSDGWPEDTYAISYSGENVNLETYDKALYFHMEERPESNVTYLEYWTFYYFNDYYNKHYGDWEFFIVELVNNEPNRCIFSRHYEVVEISWEDIEKEGTHPIMYSALGGHGFYDVSEYTSEHFGKLSVSFSEDEIITLDDTEWINYEGIWGLPDFQARIQEGPPSPTRYEISGVNAYYTPDLLNPEALRSTSVLLPYIIFFGLMFGSATILIISYEFLKKRKGRKI